MSELNEVLTSYSRGVYQGNRLYCTTEEEMETDDELQSVEEQATDCNISIKENYHLKTLFLIGKTSDMEKIKEKVGDRLDIMSFNPIDIESLY